MSNEEYVEPIVADNSGNVYISIKTANEYMDKYKQALEDIKNLLEDNAFPTTLAITIIDIAKKALGDDKQ